MINPRKNHYGKTYFHRASKEQGEEIISIKQTQSKLGSFQSQNCAISTANILVARVPHPPDKIVDLLYMEMDKKSSIGFRITPFNLRKRRHA